MRSSSEPDLEIERLNARVAELERENAEVQAFAAVAAHELVEPLVMAEAYASLLAARLDAPEHAESRDDLDALGRGVRRMRLLTDSLLHDARAGVDEPITRPVDMVAVVQDCLRLLNPEIASRDIAVEVGELPGTTGDEALLTGVVSNLLVNALKYSPRSGATVRLGGWREGDTCFFFVESEGPTIPVEDRDRIFEPFRRGTGERRARGMGLGLALCRRIVERHGGEIGVEPADESGNRFWFTLPA